jgi:hypothetical protein
MLDRLIDILLSVWNSFRPVIFILQFQKGVILRAGKYRRSLEPGWYFRIPFIDDYYTENVMYDTFCTNVITVTTSDNKTISIAGEFDLRIDNIYKNLVLTNDWRSNLMDVARGIISDTLRNHTWEEACSNYVKNKIQAKIQKRAIEMGILISNFNFTDRSISITLKLWQS